MQHLHSLRGHLNQLSIICGAIMTGVAVFAGVVWWLLSSGSMPPQGMDLPFWLGTSLNAVGLVAIVKGVLLPRIYRRPGSGAPAEDVLAWHRRNTIVAFALMEAGAFLALVGAMLTGNLLGAGLMVGLAFPAMLLAWPRESQLNP